MERKGRSLDKIPEAFKECMLNIWKNWDGVIMTEEQFLSAYPNENV